jgi:H+/Cl- antiporter ClcA
LCHACQGSYALLGATAALAGIFRSAISLVVLVVEVRDGRSASRAAGSGRTV